jgi:hypothetical protein
MARVNGGVERQNALIVDCLKKYASKDRENWPLYLPFVLYCFRTKIHTTTKYSPFELFFGRTHNKFINYSNFSSADQNTYANRLKEIEHLIDEIRANALHNIERAQTRQVNIQNGSHQITESKLPIGSRVYVKTTCMHDKLYPRYKGPYIINQHTKLDNYRLEEPNSQSVLPISYPLQKLKPVPSIFNKDKNATKSKEAINPSAAKKQRGRPRKIPVNIMTLALIFAMIVPIMATKQSKQIKIKDKFYFCEDSDFKTSSYLNPDLDDCFQIRANKSVTVSEVYILSTKVHEVDGYGYKCSKKIIKLHTEENIIGAKYSDTSEYMVPLTVDQCRNMVSTKLCGDDLMKCEKDLCTYINIPEKKFTYLSTNELEGKICKVERVSIVAKKKMIVY